MHRRIRRRSRRPRRQSRHRLRTSGRFSRDCRVHGIRPQSRIHRIEPRLRQRQYGGISRLEVQPALPDDGVHQQQGCPQAEAHVQAGAARPDRGKHLQRQDAGTRRRGYTGTDTGRGSIVWERITPQNRPGPKALRLFRPHLRPKLKKNHRRGSRKPRWERTGRNPHSGTGTSFVPSGKRCRL